MSLEDKFYPEDGTRLTRFDNAMIKSAGKVGEAYQHVTGRSYEDLIQGSYLTATSIAVSATLLFPFAYAGIDFFWSSYKEPDMGSPLEEEIGLEFRGYPKYAGKLFRICMISTIPVAGLMGYEYLTKGLEEESYRAVIGSSMILSGLSFIPGTFAHYLEKANVPKPPKKRVHEKALDKIKELLEPSLEPVPINSYGSGLNSII